MIRWTKPTRVALVAMSMLVAGSLRVAAQQPELSPRATELLQKLSGDGPAVRTELLKLDAKDIKALCAMLVEPGTADDNPARFALHGLAMAVADAGQETAQDAFVKTLAEVLGADPRPRDAGFIIEQIHWAGGARALDVLGTLLRDEGLCDPAARALLTIGGKGVVPLFQAALAEARGPSWLTIIDALAALHDTQSVPALLKDASSDDPALRRAALHALACSGQPALSDTLLKATQAESPYERAVAIDDLLIFARRLAQTKHADQAASILRNLYREHTDPADAQVRCAALSVLGDLLGPAALVDLLPALAEEDPQVRAAAVSAAAALPGKDVTQRIINDLDTAAPAARVALLDVLGRRRDPAALLTTARILDLSDSPPEVRIAAINAAVALGGERVVNPLILALSAPQTEVVKAAREALIRVPSAAATKEIVANFKPSLSPAVRVILLEIVAARPPTGDIAAVLAAAGDTAAPVRLAALGALETLAGEQDVPALLPLLLRADSDEERAASEKAVAAAVRRAAKREEAAAPVVAALEGQTVPVRSALLGALGRIGGPQALAALLGALASESPEIKTAAARAFGEWPDSGPAPQLLEFAQKTEDLKHNVLALRAYIRMIGLDARPAAESLKMCTAALEAARRPDEKKLALARLGNIREAESVKLLEPYLADAALGTEAAAAILDIVESYGAGRCRDARPPLEKVLAHDFPPAIRQRAEIALNHQADCESFITDWWVAGPYMQKDKAGNELFDVVFPPEEPGAQGIDWRKQPLNPDVNQAWAVDLAATMRGDQRAGYLFTRVYSPKEQAARLEVGSDDGIKIWLNGQVVHANNALRGASPGADKIAVTLKEGWNTLLVKVTNNDGAWVAGARFRTPDGGLLTGIRAEAGEKP